MPWREKMRYATATIGAVIIFFATVVISLVLIAYLPPSLRPELRFQMPFFRIWLNNPLSLLGLAMAFAAAVHSFRSTLRRSNKIV
jgi:hypothetical protein